MLVLVMLASLLAVLGISASPAAAAGAQPAWQLPFEKGQTWQANGPHDFAGGGSRPWGSLDFGPGSTGTNRRVVAMAAGTVYLQTCGSGSYLGVDHGNGWRSTYYHLSNEQRGLVGKAVSAGTYLGDASTTTPCGGWASANHVHVTILKDGAYTNINGFRIGGYTVRDGSVAYLGSWTSSSGSTCTVPSTGYMTCRLTSNTTPILTSTPTPTISGSATQGSTLTANAGTWAPAPVTLRYQWRRSGTNISGATARTYTLTSADVGKRMTVAVTGSKSGYPSVTKLSAATATVIGVFSNTAAPVISGTPRVGSVLRTSNGTWSPTPSSYTYQWLRDGAAISGATASSYTATTTDLGKRLSVRVTARRSGYNNRTATSAATAAVASGAMALSAPPVITGTAQVGATLTTSAPRWSPAASSVSYQWLRGGVPIPGATTTSHALGPDDVGAVITVRASGVRTGYATATSTSAPTAPVEPGVIGVVAAPTVVGTAQVGQTLTATEATWTLPPDATTLEWLADGVPIVGATAATFTVTAAEVGKVIVVRQTASKAGYTTVAAESVATAAVAKGTFVMRGKPRVSGKYKVGKKLRVTRGRWTPGPSKVRYRWFVGKKRVGSRKVLRLKRRLAGKKVSVVVTVSGPGMKTKRVRIKVKRRIRR